MNTLRIRWILFAVIAAGALAAGLYLGRQGTTSAPEPAAAAALAGLALPDPQGKEQRLDQWRGKVVIVNFWATWCAPCREEMPEFMKAQTEHGPKGLQFVGIAVDRREPVERFVKEIGVNYPVLLADVAWLDELKTMGNPQSVLPFSLAVSPAGEVLLRRVGRLKYSEIASMIG